jgi:membrane-bound lytic murein transglycosylase B
MEALGTKRFLVFLLAISLITAGCSSYASQSEKNLSEASSDIAGTTYVLEQFGNEEVSGPFVRSSLQEYAKSMQKTEKTLQSLQPPPEDKKQHEQAVQALSQAQRFVQEAGQDGVYRQEALELARRLRGFGEELKA